MKNHFDAKLIKENIETLRKIRSYNIKFKQKVTNYPLLLSSLLKLISLFSIFKQQKPSSTIPFFILCLMIYFLTHSTDDSYQK